MTCKFLKSWKWILNGIKHYDSINNTRGEGRLWEFIFTTTDTSECQNSTLFFEYVLYFLLRLPPILELCDPKIDYLWHLQHLKTLLNTSYRHQNIYTPCVYSPVRLKHTRLCICECSAGYQCLNTAVSDPGSTWNCTHWKFFIDTR